MMLKAWKAACILHPLAIRLLWVSETQIWSGVPRAFPKSLVFYHRAQAKSKVISFFLECSPQKERPPPKKISSLSVECDICKWVKDVWSGTSVNKSVLGTPCEPIFSSSEVWALQFYWFIEGLLWMKQALLKYVSHKAVSFWQVWEWNFTLRFLCTVVLYGSTQ